MGRWGDGEMGRWGDGGNKSYQVRIKGEEAGKMPALLEFFDMTGVGASCSLDF
jgi:hypothetical protein